MCNNCAFYDKSMKLCTELKHYMKKIFSYRGITDIFCKKISTSLKIVMNNYHNFNNNNKIKEENTLVN